MKHISLLYLIIAFTLNGVANVLLKRGALAGLRFKGLSPLDLATNNAALVGGLVLFALNVGFYFLALRTVPVSIAYPVMVVMSVLIINGFAYFYLQESLNAMQLLGYALMIAGLILVFYFSQKAPLA